MAIETERRIITTKNMRASTDGGQPKISGYAALFNALSDDLGGFRERIQPGAFTRALDQGQDVRALINHDPSLILGRTKSGTLTLREDEAGLYFEVSPADVSYARDIIVSIQRGDVDQMSFAFSVNDTNEAGDDWAMVGDQIIRTLRSVDLYDVAPVTYPAYPQTSAHVRSKLHQLQDSTKRGQAPVVGSPNVSPQERLDLLQRRLALTESF